jgi:hypothetical protein
VGQISFDAYRPNCRIRLACLFRPFACTEVDMKSAITLIAPLLRYNATGYCQMNVDQVMARLKQPQANESDQSTAQTQYLTWS